MKTRSKTSAAAHAARSSGRLRGSSSTAWAHSAPAQQRPRVQHLLLQQQQGLAEQRRLLLRDEPPLHRPRHGLAQPLHLGQQHQGRRVPRPALGRRAPGHRRQRGVHLRLGLRHLAQQLEVGPHPVLPEEGAQQLLQRPVAQARGFEQIRAVLEPRPQECPDGWPRWTSTMGDPGGRQAPGGHAGRRVNGDAPAALDVGHGIRRDAPVNGAWA